MINKILRNASLWDSRIQFQIRVLYCSVSKPFLSFVTLYNPIQYKVQMLQHQKMCSCIYSEYYLAVGTIIVIYSMYIYTVFTVHKMYLLSINSKYDKKQQ